MKAGASWRSRPPSSSTTTTCWRRVCWHPAASPSTPASTPARPPSSKRFAADLVPLLRPQDDVEDFRDGRPEVRAAVANAERFLVLAALVSVLLGGVAVAMAARRFVARRLDAVALMKCLGARHREVLRLNVLQLLILVVAAGVIGCLIGFVAQFGLTALLADFIEAKLPPASLQGAVLGPLTALAVAVGCALPPLLQLGGVPPARVLRNDIGPPPLRYSTIYGVAAAAVTGAALRAVRRLRAHRLPAGGHGRHVLRAVLCRAVARAGAAAVSWRRRRRLAVRYRERRPARPREQRAGGRVRHRSHGAVAADVGAHGADDGVAGDAAGERAQSLSH